MLGSYVSVPTILYCIRTRKAKHFHLPVGVPSPYTKDPRISADACRLPPLLRDTGEIIGGHDVESEKSKCNTDILWEVGSGKRWDLRILRF
jgi:hypothetical protein